VNPRLLRLVRYISLIGFCILAGYYTGKIALSRSDRTAPESLLVTPQMLSESATTVTTTGSSYAGASLPDLLPDIRLADLDGKIHALAEWADGPLLINFWATWCAPCLREMPLLESVWQAQRNEALVIIGIAVDRIEAVGPYVDKTGVTYPILVGQSDAMEAADAFGPDFAGLPYTVFAASGGRVVGTYSGELHAEQLAEILAVVADASVGRITIDAAREKLAH